MTSHAYTHKYIHFIQHLHRKVCKWVTPGVVSIPMILCKLCTFIPTAFHPHRIHKAFLYRHAFRLDRFLFGAHIHSSVNKAKHPVLGKDLLFWYAFWIHAELSASNDSRASGDEWHRFAGSAKPRVLRHMPPTSPVLYWATKGFFFFRVKG